MKEARDYHRVSAGGKATHMYSDRKYFISVILEE